MIGANELKEKEKAMKKADKITTLSFTRWKADWLQATPMYEQAATTFKLGKHYEKAMEAFEKAATGQERLGSPFSAAKHMESAGMMAKEAHQWTSAAASYSRACELYLEAGRPQPASDALFKGARAVEDHLPEEALRMYTEAISMCEEEGREQNAGDVFRAAVSLYLKLERWNDGATMLLRQGLAFDSSKGKQSQCKAYASAVIVYLYAEDVKQAEKCYNDCSEVEAFGNSEQGEFTRKLLQAYRDGDGEEVKYVISKSKNIVDQLDHMIIRLANKLPTGGMKAIAGTSSAAAHDELDPDDLT
ncbi:hypothetical protein CBR_g24190 [Chara braunii]|uniref:Gamma-soluble NSF attachment protein n=1 Tax=Chara braunii TaxID=69332 RepID=A0A388L6B2_CHABU|nr:hypothetical protein CBR_g24190 [Chara braunii]|eukprot:GBG77743.1 hypothetical protein CBR_g24190 [Chara braunii]